MARPRTRRLAVHLHGERIGSLDKQDVDRGRATIAKRFGVSVSNGFGLLERLGAGVPPNVTTVVVARFEPP